MKALGNRLQSPLLLILRLYWGYEFMITGFGKLTHLDMVATYFQTLGIPLPSLTAFLTGSVELIGGALLFLGLFSRLATLPLLCIMIAAYLTADREGLTALFHLNPEPFFARTPFLFTYALVIILSFGPGKYSFDAWLKKDGTP